MNSKLKFFAVIAFFTLLYIFYYTMFKEELLMPGTVDTWLNLSILKDIESLITLQSSTSSNYPEGLNYLYGEYSFMSGIIFTILNFVFKQDYLSYINFYILVGILNSYSLFLLIENYFKTNYFNTIIIVFFFTFCSFNLAFSDNVFYTIWFPFFFSLFFLLKSKKLTNLPFTILSILFLGSQLYFSVYNFFMAVIIYLIIVIFNFSVLITRPKVLSISIVTLMMMMAPYFFIYITYFKIDEFYNSVLSLNLISYMSLNFLDLTNSFDSNLFYGNNKVNETLVISDYWKIINIGLLLPFIAVLGLYLSKGRTKYIFISVFVIGIFLSFDMIFPLKELKIKIYQLIPFLLNFKLVFKFYYLILFSIVFFSSHLVVYIQRFPKISRNSKLCILGTLILIFLLENLPANPTQHSTEFVSIDINKEILLELKTNNAVILFLPSFPPDIHKNLNNSCMEYIFQQEYKYLYWQSIINLNVINGANGFIPNNRLDVDRIFKNNDSKTAIQILKEKWNLSHIVYIKEFKKKCNSYDLTYFKKNYSCFFENQDLIIFMVAQ
jgi:hypothetical protein